MLTRETTIRIFLFAVLVVGWFVTLSLNEMIYIFQYNHPSGGEDWLSWARFITNNCLPFAVMLFSFILAEWNIERKLDFASLPQEYNNVQEMLQNLSNAVGLENTPELRFLAIQEPNAFTYGKRRKKAKIVLSKGLIEALSEEELTAVIAHELSHIRHGDTILMTWGNTLLQSLKYWLSFSFLLVALGLFISYLEGDLTPDLINLYLTLGLPILVGFAIVFYLTPFLIFNSISRIREFLADDNTCRLVEEKYLRSALRRIYESLILLKIEDLMAPSILSIMNFSPRRILPDFVAKHTIATHPTIKARFQEIEKKQYIKSWENVSRIDRKAIYNGIIASVLFFIGGATGTFLPESDEFLEFVFLFIIPFCFIFWVNSDESVVIMNTLHDRSLKQKSIGLLKMVVKNGISMITMYLTLEILTYRFSYIGSFWLFLLISTGFTVFFVLTVLVGYILAPFIWSYVKDVIDL